MNSSPSAWVSESDLDAKAAAAAEAAAAQQQEEVDRMTNLEWPDSRSVLAMTSAVQAITARQHGWADPYQM